MSPSLLPALPRTTALLRDQQRDTSLHAKLPRALTESEIVIVGGGIAGLEAAARLSASGARVTVYEGSHRPGGRICTELLEGHTVERGAQLSNGWDESLHGRVHHLGLNLRNVYRGAQRGQMLGFIHNAGYTGIKELVRDLKPLQDKMKEDIATHGSHQAAQRNAASLSLKEYAAASGIAPRALELLVKLFVSEYGIGEPEIRAQGLFAEGFHLLDPENPAIWGAGYAQYVISEGTGAITDELSKRTEDIRFNHRLRKVVASDDGYTLTFDSNGTEIVRHAPLLVIAVPFSALRHVDLSEAKLSPERLHCIREMRYGQSAKTFVRGRTEGDSRNVDEFVDCEEGYSVWNDHRNSSEPSDVWTVYTHGDEEMTEAELVPRLNKTISPGFERVIGRATWNCELSGGSYSIDNQHLPRAGVRSTERPGKLYFAGEHTQIRASYMNAAVRSGELVAHLIVRHVLKQVAETR